MDVKITMQVDCWKRCYCGLTLTANDKGCIPSIQHRWTMAPYHATRFFFSFPSSLSVLCRLSAYFLLLQEQWNLYFKGGFEIGFVIIFSRKWNRKVVMRDTRLVHVNIVCWYIFVTSWQSLVLKRMWHEREKTFNTMTGTNLWQSDV